MPSFFPSRLPAPSPPHAPPPPRHHQQEEPHTHPPQPEDIDAICSTLNTLSLSPPGVIYRRLQERQHERLMRERAGGYETVSDTETDEVVRRGVRKLKKGEEVGLEKWLTVRRAGKKRVKGGEDNGKVREKGDGGEESGVEADPRGWSFRSLHEGKKGSSGEEEEEEDVGEEEGGGEVDEDEGWEEVKADEGEEEWEEVPEDISIL